MYFYLVFFFSIFFFDTYPAFKEPSFAWMRGMQQRQKWQLSSVQYILKPGCRRVVITMKDGCLIKEKEPLIGVDAFSYQFSPTHPHYSLYEEKGGIVTVWDDRANKPVAAFPILKQNEELTFYALNADGDTIIAITNTNPQKVVTYRLK